MTLLPTVRPLAPVRKPELASPRQPGHTRVCVKGLAGAQRPYSCLRYSPRDPPTRLLGDEIRHEAVQVVDGWRPGRRHLSASSLLPAQRLGNRAAPPCRDRRCRRVGPGAGGPTPVGARQRCRRCPLALALRIGDSGQARDRLVCRRPARERGERTAPARPPPVCAHRRHQRAGCAHQQERPRRIFRPGETLAIALRSWLILLNVAVIFRRLRLSRGQTAACSTSGDGA